MKNFIGRRKNKRAIRAIPTKKYKQSSPKQEREITILSFFHKNLNNQDSSQVFNSSIAQVSAFKKRSSLLRTIRHKRQKDIN